MNKEKYLKFHLPKDAKTVSFLHQDDGGIDVICHLTDGTKVPVFPSKSTIYLPIQIIYSHSIQNYCAEVKCCGEILDSFHCTSAEKAEELVELWLKQQGAKTFDE